MPMSKSELGARRPTHVGTRTLTDEGSAALCAFPSFRGEVIERIALDVACYTTDDNTNFDQPPIISWVGIHVPWNYQHGGIGTGDIDGQITDMFGAHTDYLGGEPNPSGNIPWGGEKFGQVGSVWFKRNVIGNPVPVGKDAVDNADARFIDRFRTVVKRPFEVQADTLSIFASRVYRLDAQTDFGVAEIDVSATMQDMANAYRRLGIGQGLSTQALKAHELLYGGDNYIEADSFKETDRRSYAIVRPTIRRSARLLSAG